MENTFEQELMRHIEFLNLLAMSEDDEYQYKEMIKMIVELVKESNHAINGGDRQ